MHAHKKQLIRMHILDVVCEQKCLTVQQVIDFLGLPQGYVHTALRQLEKENWLTIEYEERAGKRVQVVRAVTNSTKI